MVMTGVHSRQRTFELLKPVCWLFFSTHKYLNYPELGVKERTVSELASSTVAPRRYELSVKATAVKYRLSYLAIDA